MRKCAVDRDYQNDQKLCLCDGICSLYGTVQGVSCMRKCAVDCDCQNDRKLCLCDGICSLYCTVCRV
jgi:hypothetical protein